MAQKHNQNYGAVLANFSSTFTLQVSTYQNTGTSDFQMYLQKLSDGSRVEIQNWRGSTGGSFVPVEEFSLQQFITYMMNYTLYIDFKDQSAATSTWWLPTPILDTHTGYETPEILNNVISAYIRGTTIEFNTDDVFGIRKSTTSLSTVMTVKLRISVAAAQTYPNDGYVSIYFRNIQGSPTSYTQGLHTTRLIRDDNEVFGTTYVPVTTTTPILGSNNQKIMSTIRGSTYRIYGYAGQSLKTLSPATDAFRTAAFNSLYTAGASFGSYSLFNDGTTSYIGQVGIFHGLSFPNPQIERTGFPYLTVRLLITGNPSIRVTVWNTTGGYLYVNGQQSYQNIHFMSDGAGTGSSKISTISGNIVCVFFQVDQYGFAINTTSIPRYTFPATTLLSQAQATPNTLVSQTLAIPTNLRYSGAPIQMIASAWYATTTNPPDPDLPPEPVPQPPVPTPVIETVEGTDKFVRQEKAVESTREEFEEKHRLTFLFPLFGETKPIQERKKDLIEEAKTQGYNTRTEYQQMNNHFAQVLREFNSMIKGNPELLSQIYGREDRTFPEVQKIISYKGDAELYPGIMHPASYHIINKFGKTSVIDLINFAKAFKEPNVLAGRPTFANWANEYPDALQQADWLSKDKKNPYIPIYGVPYSVFNTTDKLFNMTGFQTTKQFFELPSPDLYKKHDALPADQQWEKLSNKFVEKYPTWDELAAAAFTGALAVTLGGLSLPISAGVAGLIFMMARSEQEYDLITDPIRTVKEQPFTSVAILGSLTGSAIAATLGSGALTGLKALTDGIGGTKNAVKIFQDVLDLNRKGQHISETGGLQEKSDKEDFDTFLTRAVTNTLMGFTAKNSIKYTPQEIESGVTIAAYLVNQIVGYELIPTHISTTFFNTTAGTAFQKVALGIQILGDPLAQLGLLGLAVYKGHEQADNIARFGKRAISNVQRTTSNFLEGMSDSIMTIDQVVRIPYRMVSYGIDKVNQYRRSKSAEIPIQLTLPGQSVASELTTGDLPGIVIDYIKAKYDLKGMVQLFESIHKDSTGALLGAIVKEAIVESGKPRPFSEVRRRVDITRARLQGRDLIAEEQEAALLEAERINLEFAQKLGRRRAFEVGLASVLTNLHMTMQGATDQVYDYVFQKATNREVTSRWPERQGKPYVPIELKSTVDLAFDWVSYKATPREGISRWPKRGVSRNMPVQAQNNTLSNLTESIARADPTDVAEIIQAGISRGVQNLTEEETIQAEAMSQQPEFQEKVNQTVRMYPELAEQINITQVPARNTSFSKNETQDDASGNSYKDYGFMFALGAAAFTGAAYLGNKAYNAVFPSSDSTTPPPPVPTPAKVADPAKPPAVTPADVYTAMNSDPDTAIKFAHEIKHINLQQRLGEGLQLFLITNAMAFPRLTEANKQLRTTVQARSHEGRQAIMHGLHQLLHAVQRNTNYENVVVQNTVLKGMQAYFKTGMNNAQMTGDRKGFSFFKILDSIVEPETEQEERIQEEFFKYINSDYLHINSSQDLFKPVKQYNSLHNIERHPHLILDFIERVVSKDPEYRDALLGGKYPAERPTRSYALPAEPLKLRAIPEYKPPRKREVKQVMRGSVLQKPSSYLEPRQTSEYSENRDFNLKRQRRF